MSIVSNLYLIVPKIIKFIQSGEYGKYTKQYDCQQIEYCFNHPPLNSTLIKLKLSSLTNTIGDSNTIIRISNKHLLYLHHFQLTHTGMMKHNINIPSIGTFILKLHICLHLKTLQPPTATILKKVKWTLTDWYLHVLLIHREEIQSITRYITINAYFSKANFINNTLDMGYHIIGRLRNDSFLRYLTVQTTTGKKGRPKLYDEKIQITNLKRERFEIIELDGNKGRILSAIVNSVALDRNIRLCIWESHDGNTLYFSTDLQITAKDMMKYHKVHFQINHRYLSVEKTYKETDTRNFNSDNLHFGFNISLVSTNRIKPMERLLSKVLPTKQICRSTNFKKKINLKSDIQLSQKRKQKQWKEEVKLVAIVVSTQFRASPHFRHFFSA